MSCDVSEVQHVAEGLDTETAGSELKRSNNKGHSHTWYKHLTGCFDLNLTAVSMSQGCVFACIFIKLL